MTRWNSPVVLCHEGLVKLCPNCDFGVSRKNALHYIFCALITEDGRFSFVVGSHVDLGLAVLGLVVAYWVVDFLSKVN